MATLGGSTRSDPLGVPLVGGTDGSFAANARVPTNVINAAASGVSRKPRRVSKIGISICVLSSSRIIRNSRENINVIPDGCCLSIKAQFLCTIIYFRLHKLKCGSYL
jgi:hypothetical protein